MSDGGAELVTVRMPAADVRAARMAGLRVLDATPADVRIGRLENAITEALDVLERIERKHPKSPLSSEIRRAIKRGVEAVM